MGMNLIYIAVVSFIEQFGVHIIGHEWGARPTQLAHPQFPVRHQGCPMWAPHSAPQQAACQQAKSVEQLHTRAVWIGKHSLLWGLVRGVQYSQYRTACASRTSRQYSTSTDILIRENASTAPVQHQYSTSTAPVQHQYRTHMLSSTDQYRQ